MPRPKTLANPKPFSIMVPRSEMAEWKRYAVKHYEGNVSQFIRSIARKAIEREKVRKAP